MFAWVMMMPLTAIVTIFCFLCPLMWPYMLHINFDKTPEKGGRRWQPARKLFIWNYFQSYFPVEIKAEAELDPSKNYFFCMFCRVSHKSRHTDVVFYLGAHPHGILPLSLFSNFATEATNTTQLFPNHLFHVRLPVLP